MQHLHHNCNGQELIFLKKGNGKFVSTSISIFSGPLNRNFFILDKTLEGTTNGKKKKRLLWAVKMSQHRYSSQLSYIRIHSFKSLNILLVL